MREWNQPPRVVEVVLHGVTELLSNVARHAGAHTVRVTLAAADDGDAPALTLVVRDDGTGLGGPADPTRWEREGHMGFVGMRERIAALGGTVAIANGARGAELRVSVPLDGS